MFRYGTTCVGQTADINLPQTQQSTAVVVVTAVYTAPACSATPVIVNPDFDTLETGWKLDNSLGKPGSSIDWSTDYYYADSATTSA